MKDFDIAISFCSEESWFANDLHKLLTNDGLLVYNFNFYSNYVQNKFRAELKEIYKKSKVNIIVYSTSYMTKSKNEETPIFHEFQSLWERHLINNSLDDLFVITCDNTNINQKLKNSDIRFFSVKDEGLLNIHEFFRVKLSKLWTLNDGEIEKYYKHPKGEEIKRKEISFCTFQIDDNFQNDKLKRHDKFGDIEVCILKSEEIKKNYTVFLMPSDNAPFYLSHPRVLLSESEIYKKIRQEINLQFYEQYKNQELIGGLFYIETGEHKVKLPNIYSRTYDTFLVENLEKFARKIL